jgi:aldehyde dehydrogenase (NAD+)
MTITSTSPQRPSDVVATAAETSASAVATLVDAARSAQVEWSTAAVARSQALRHAAERLRARQDEAAALIVREVGKPIIEAKGEVARSLAILDYYAQAALDPIGTVIPPTMPGMLMSVRVPHGVAGLITPWNFPLAIPLWKAAPALAMGNTVVLKPSEHAIGCASLLAEVLGEALPAHVFAIAPGFADTGRALIDAADVVSFTGSVAVGRQVVAAAAAAGKPVQAEMGGQNPAIVLPDADLELVSTHLAQAAMGFAGQKCTATRRVIAVGDAGRVAAVREALIAGVERLTPDDPGREGVLVGPLITADARSNLFDAIARAQHAGRVLYGGGALDRDGWFVAPAIIDAIPAHDALLTEETFAPLVAVQDAATVAEAIMLANDVRFGLTASVHGRDVEALLRVAQSLKTGQVKINAPTAGVDFHAPFGGTKDSSYGPREQGKSALAFYSYERTITLGSGSRLFD